MKKLILCLSLLLSLNLFADENCALKLESNNVCINVEWLYGPFINQYSSARVGYSELTQGLSLKAIPWMIMEGGHQHGSRPVKQVKINEREFLLEDIFFMGGMKGHWFLKFQLVDGKGRVLEEGMKEIL